MSRTSQKNASQSAIVTVPNLMKEQIYVENGTVYSKLLCPLCGESFHFETHDEIDEATEELTFVDGLHRFVAFCDKAKWNAASRKGLLIELK